MVLAQRSAVSTKLVLASAGPLTSANYHDSFTKRPAVVAPTMEPGPGRAAAAAAAAYELTRRRPMSPKQSPRRIATGSVRCSPILAAHAFTSIRPTSRGSDFSLADSWPKAGLWVGAAPPQKPASANSGVRLSAAPAGGRPSGASPRASPRRFVAVPPPVEEVPESPQADGNQQTAAPASPHASPPSRRPSPPKSSPPPTKSSTSRSPPTSRQNSMSFRNTSPQRSPGGGSDGGGGGGVAAVEGGGGGSAEPEVKETAVKETAEEARARSKAAAAASLHQTVKVVWTEAKWKELLGPQLPTKRSSWIRPAVLVSRAFADIFADVREKHGQAATKRRRRKKRSTLEDGEEHESESEWEDETEDEDGELSYKSTPRRSLDREQTQRNLMGGVYGAGGAPADADEATPVRQTELMMRARSVSTSEQVTPASARDSARRKAASQLLGGSEAERKPAEAEMPEEEPEEEATEPVAALGFGVLASPTTAAPVESSRARGFGRSIEL